MSNDWLKELKAGDEVVVRDGGPHFKGDVVERVAKITAMQITLKNGARYSRKTGMLHGGTMLGWSSLKQAAPERITAIIEGDV